MDEGPEEPRWLRLMLVALMACLPLGSIAFYVIPGMASGEISLLRGLGLAGVLVGVLMALAVLYLSEERRASSRG